MRYVTSVERIGIEKGVRQGLQEGEQKGERKGLLRDIEVGMKLKFGDAGMDLMPEVRKIENVDVLVALQEGLLTVSSIEELRRIYLGRISGNLVLELRSRNAPGPVGPGILPLRMLPEARAAGCGFAAIQAGNAFSSFMDIPEGG